jgi:hypothetical protein
MKRVLLLIFVSMLVTALEMKSQSDCDCAGTWTEETEFFDGRDISCQFIVTYEKCSDGSEGPFHLRITGIEFLDGGNCENLSEEYIMHYATRLLLDECDNIFYTADWSTTASKKELG